MYPRCSCLCDFWQSSKGNTSERLKTKRKLTKHLSYHFLSQENEPLEEINLDQGKEPGKFRGTLCPGQHHRCVDNMINPVVELAFKKM